MLYIATYCIVPYTVSNTSLIAIRHVQRIVSLIEQIIRGMRYSDPQRVTLFRRSYRLVSGRSLLEDSITLGDGRRDRP